MSLPTFITNRLGAATATTLEKFGYLSSGTVTAQITLDQTDQFNWYLDATKGYYVENNRLQYNYIDKQTSTQSSTIGANTYNLTTGFNPNKGPVIVYEDGGDETYFIPHNNAFYPALDLSWTVSGAYYRCTLPTDSYLASVRDFYGVELNAVALQADLLETTQYWYDTSTNKVYIIPEDTANIQIYPDVIYDTPQLLYRELVIQEALGVRPSYKYIEEVVVSKGSDTESINSGGTFFGDYITHSIPDVNIGDWVVLEYYIKFSFVLTDAYNIEWYIGSSGTTNDINITYEGSLARSTAKATSINVNPLSGTNRSVGYVIDSATNINGIEDYHLSSVSQLVLLCDKTTLRSDFADTTLLTLLALDDKNNLMPDVRVFFWNTEVIAGGTHGTLTFSGHVGAGSGTITATSGSWVTEGIAVASVIDITESATASHNQRFTVTGVTDLVLTGTTTATVVAGTDSTLTKLVPQGGYNVPLNLVNVSGTSIYPSTVNSEGKRYLYAKGAAAGVFNITAYLPYVNSNGQSVLTSGGVNVITSPTLLMASPIEAGVPAKGRLRVYRSGTSGTYDEYNYSSWAGSTFTLNIANHPGGLTVAAVTKSVYVKGIIKSNPIIGTAIATSPLTNSLYRKGVSQVSQVNHELFIEQFQMDGTPKLTEGSVLESDSKALFNYQGTNYSQSASLPSPTTGKLYYGNSVSIDQAGKFSFVSLSRDNLPGVI